MTIRAGTSRTLFAAVLLAALLAALLGAWFVSGWHDVRTRQAETRHAPHVAASARADELARELHAELEGLLAREVRRPYFHYQNLMHDPRSSAEISVTPSPLAKAPEDALVLGYFQIDSKGRASTPTINDEVPELSDAENFAAHRAFRDQVVRDLAHVLRPPASASSVLVADAPRRRPPSPPQTQVAPPQAPEQQIIQIDQSSYSQNMSSNQVWQQSVGDVTQRDAPVANEPTTTTTRPTRPTRPTAPRAAPRPAQVTITVSPLEWRTLPYGSLPALVAVRHVQTPDGNLAQGFVVDRATLTSWLAGKAGDMVAELHATTSDPRAATAAAAGAPAIAPGWLLGVTPNPRAIARAAADAASVARTFLLRFVLVGAVALVAAAFVLLLVMRAERLAHERSQFAAAAAHELRTPLAGLQLYGDMMAEGLGDPGKLSDYARRMSEEAARLGRVVSNVLGFSQLERGNLSVDPQLGSLTDALRELAERAELTLDRAPHSLRECCAPDVRRTCDRANATLELDVEPDLRARFDRDALARIVGNLLDNAEKYARGADDRTIRLAARDRGDVVEISVRDHGPGIANPASLFKPFARGVTADGPAGLGLGLALSRSLAEAMGGELGYRAAADGGAELVLKLPRA